MNDHDRDAYDAAILNLAKLLPTLDARDKGGRPYLAARLVDVGRLLVQLGNATTCEHVECVQRILRDVGALLADAGAIGDTIVRAFDRLTDPASAN